MNSWQRTYLRQKEARVRFLRNCEIVDGCWIWRGLIQDGYGKVRLNGKMRNAHRAAYALFKGEVPKGDSVIRSCENILCCCPDHLYLDIQEQRLSTLVATSWQR